MGRETYFLWDPQAYLQQPSRNISQEAGCSGKSEMFVLIAKLDANRSSRVGDNIGCQLSIQMEDSSRILKMPCVSLTDFNKPFSISQILHPHWKGRNTELSLQHFHKTNEMIHVKWLCPVHRKHWADKVPLVPGLTVGKQAAHCLIMWFGSLGKAILSRHVF